jgi:hypothetical protein
VGVTGEEAVVPTGDAVSEGDAVQQEEEVAPPPPNGPVGDAQVTLVSRGKGRKRHLQLEFSPDVDWDGRLEVGTTSTITTDEDAPEASNALEVVGEYALRTTDASHVQMVTEHVVILDDDPMALGQMMPLLEPLQELTLDVEVSPRHVVHVGVPPLPEDMPETSQVVLGHLVAAVQGMAVPFPEEAVGRGATWDVVQTVRQDGLLLTHTLHCTLRGWRGDVVQVLVDGTLTRQDDGALEDVSLDAFDGTTSGKLWFRVDRALPIAATWSTTTEAVVRWRDMEGADHQGSVSATQEVAWVTRDAPQVDAHAEE